MQLNPPSQAKLSMNVFKGDSYSESSRALNALNSIGDAVICTDMEGQVEFMNTVAETLTGWTNSEAVGKPLRQIFPIINSVTRHPDIDVAGLVVKTGRLFRLPPNTAMIKRDGTEILVEDASTLITNQAGKRYGVVIVFRDVSVSQANANRMAYLAQHDTLTGLPNRHVLTDRITQEMKVSRRLKSRFSLLYIDLDDFKLVNDNWSHTVGDRVLIEIAARLVHCMRDTDTVSRIGGDEFVILLCGFGDVHNISAITKKILESLAAPIVVNGQQHLITASIGVSVFPEHGPDSESMLNNADAAMYLVKKDGGNNCRITGMMSNQHTA